MNPNPAPSVVAELAQSNQLPCGCQPGRFLCPEAERLWWRVHDLCQKASFPYISNERRSLLVTLSDQARQDYDRHFATIERSTPA